MRAVRWLINNVQAGALFRSAHHDRRLTPEYVKILVEQAVGELGLDAGEYSSHSLRAGFVTEMRARAVPDHLIMRQTRHKRLGDARTI